MVAIRAHYDGVVVVLDEPVSLPPHAQVVVLAESAGTASLDALEKATREYYRELANAGGTPGDGDGDWGA